MSDTPPAPATPPAHTIVVLSDAHFFNPYFYAEVIQHGNKHEPPSRLSTDLALADKKINPFFAVLQLAREKRIVADTLVCCGDLTTCADPTAMNLGWLQLQRLAAELGAGPVIATAGNHDVDSRFQTSRTNPSRMLRFLDPPFPTSEPAAEASFWANGYCIIDSGEARFVLVNSCSLHGYRTEDDRQSDHGAVPEQVFQLLSDDLAQREPKALNFLVCHHHPVDIDAPPEDKSIISNGDELIALLESLSPPTWVVLHGHRHLASIRYATASALAPVIFSAGSFAANLHLGLQSRTQNQFYVLRVESDQGVTMGRYSTWTWDSYGGEWLEGQDTRALPARGGFGFKPNPTTAAATIAPLVPPRSMGTVTWKAVEDTLPEMGYMLLDQRRPILEALSVHHDIHWESDSGKFDAPGTNLRLGRTL